MAAAPTRRLETPPAFNYTVAVALHSTEKYDECVALCRQGVAAGDAKAQAVLASCYHSGDGVQHDAAEAVRLARLAAAQGDPEGLRVLGVCHQNGLGDLPVDHERAADLCRLSAAQGWVDGQRDYAIMLEAGTGVPQDREAARRLNLKACAQGDGVALDAAAEVPCRCRRAFRSAV